MAVCHNPLFSEAYCPAGSDVCPDALKRGRDGLAAAVTSFARRLSPDPQPHHGVALLVGCMTACAQAKAFSVLTVTGAYVSAFACSAHISRSVVLF